MIQFLKSGDTGELFAVKKYLPGIKIVQFGHDAISDEQAKIFQFGGEEKIKPVGPKHGKYYIFFWTAKSKNRADEHWSMHSMFR